MNKRKEITDLDLLSVVCAPSSRLANSTRVGGRPLIEIGRFFFLSQYLDCWGRFLCLLPGPRPNHDVKTQNKKLHTSIQARSWKDRNGPVQRRRRPLFSASERSKCTPHAYDHDDTVRARHRTLMLGKPSRPPPDRPSYRSRVWSSSAAVRHLHRLPRTTTHRLHTHDT